MKNCMKEEEREGERAKAREREPHPLLKEFERSFSREKRSPSYSERSLAAPGGGNVYLK